MVEIRRAFQAGWGVVQQPVVARYTETSSKLLLFPLVTIFYFHFVLLCDRSIARPKSGGGDTKTGERGCVAGSDLIGGNVVLRDRWSHWKGGRMEKGKSVKSFAWGDPTLSLFLFGGEREEKGGSEVRGC